MARRYTSQEYRSPRHRRRRRVPRPETTFQTAIRYGAIAIASGLGIAFAAHQWEVNEKRQAILDALPPGYQYSNCDAVRAAGVDPLYSYEPGFSDRMDGDGDGVACEPYRGN